MRLHRFFIEDKIGNDKKVKIENDELAHQWRNVFRYQVGQEIILLDNSGSEFRAMLVSLTNRVAEVEIISKRIAGFTPALPLFIFLSLAKRDAFEWALEKGTELGVSGFIPVISERSEKKKLNIERSKLIIKESCEQSGRAIMPEVFEPVTLAESLKNLAGSSVVLEPNGEPFSVSAYKTGERVNVFIGPEGGWSKNELELFKKHNIQICSLGRQVLRTETAVAAISSILLLKFV